MKYRDDFYAEHHPTPGDVLFIIEVADSSLGYDKEIKIPLYAKADIQEVWLVNLIENTVEIYSDPCPEGYNQIIKRHSDQAISPENISYIKLTVSHILGLSS